MNVLPSSRTRSALLWPQATRTEITYQSEWLGYMPFPVDHWVEHQGKTFSGDFPFDWTLEDLASLERTGFLEKLEAYENPEDRFDRCIRYRVHVGRA
jgi:hypothetical protein